MGPSGVGKTTLVSLMLRFYRPTAGEIWFDGRPASDYEVSSLRGRIGYVSQSTLLLSGTILDNLRYEPCGGNCIASVVVPDLPVGGFFTQTVDVGDPGIGVMRP